MLKKSVVCAVSALSVAVLFGSTAVATPVGGQLLADDFETGIGGWVAEGGGGGALISTDAFAGTGALEVDYVNDFEGAKIAIALDPSDRLSELSLGFVYKEAADGFAGIEGIRPVVAEFSPSGISFHVGDFGWAGSAWQAWPAFNITLNRPDADALVIIFQGHTNKPGSFLVDEVALTKLVPEPASLGLLAVGAAAMVSRRRWTA
jgi:PEP-CTERM motif